MKRAPVKERLRGLLGEIFSPIPSGTIEGWGSGKETADGKPNIYLSEKESGDFPGAYNPELNPLPTILFSVFRSGLYGMAVFLKSSQSGVTFAVLVLICWFVTFMRRNFLYVIDSEKEVEKIGDERLKPMLKRCKAALSNTKGEDVFKALVISLKRCTGYLVGAQSIGGLSNKSAGLIILDEVDAYPIPRKGKESAIALALERGKKQARRFVVMLSKPIYWSGPITQNYLIGTRHHCFVPCPHCGEFQELTRDRLRYEHCRDPDNGAWFSDRILSDTWYECLNAACGEKRIEQKHKPAMLKRREWRQTNFGQDEHKPEPRRFSCKITDMYSTFPTATFGHIALELALSEHDPVARQTVLAGRFAEGLRRAQVKVVAETIFEMRGEYRRGECPVMPDIVVMYIDVQKRVFKWTKCAFTLDDTCYIIDYGETLTLAEAWSKANVPVKVLGEDDESKWPLVYRGWLDEGYDQKMARDFVTSEQNCGTPDQWIATRWGMIPKYRFFTSWGQGGIHARQLRDLVTPRPDEKPNATHNGKLLYAYRYSDDHFKDELYNLRIGGFPQYRASLEPDSGIEAPEFFNLTVFPKDIDPQFALELCQEEWTWLEKLGREGWKDPQGPNDYGDGVKCCIAQWYLAKPFVEIRIARERLRRLRKGDQ